MLSNLTGFTGDKIYRPETGQIDFGITEAIGDLVGAGRDKLTGGSQMTQGELTTAKAVMPYRPAAGLHMANTTASGMEQAANSQASQPIVQSTAQQQQQQVDPNASAAGGATGSGATGSGASGSGSSTSQAVNPYQEMMNYWQRQLDSQNSVMQQWMEREAAAKEAQKQAAQSAYDEVLRQSEQMKTSAQGKYDTNVGDINSRYDTLASRIGDQIGNLTSRNEMKQSSIEDAYNQAKAQQFAAKGKTDTQNRNLARAMNRGDSSFYEDIMAGNADQTAEILNSLLGNRNSSRDDLAQQFLESRTALDNQAADSESERSNMLSGALDEYNAAIETARELASKGLIDYNSAVAGIQSNAANNLLQAAQQRQSNNINQASIMAAFQGALGNLGQVNPGLNSVNTGIPTSIANMIGNLDLLNQVDNTNPALANLMSMSNRDKTKQLGV